MYRSGQENPGFMPQQERPNARSSLTNNQPRRPLAINDMLNHGAPPWFPRDTRSETMSQPSYGHRIAELTSYLPPPGQYQPPSLPPPPGSQTTAPQTYHLYQPGTTYRPPVYSTTGSRIELPAPPPIGTSEQHWEGDYYMSHSRIPVPPPQYSSGVVPVVPVPHFRISQEVATPAGRPGPNWTRKTCVLCLEKWEGIDPKNHFPHQCKRCASGDFCAGCLKDWFLDACKNESKMPPKCCSIIPLSAVTNLLNRSQIELYKAKYEEWATPDRLYCPIPTCSTFIPQRLYIKVRQGPSAPHNNSFNLDSSTLINTSKKDINPHVACPTCGVAVCTKCRTSRHIGECPESDLDPALEEQLKKWRIKRCPKCRAGVRRMYGCSHIECRCGAHFCWECLLPINQCGGQCDDEASDADPAEYQVEEDDLDGNAGFYEGAGPDFGPEPYGNTIDAWGCQHVWSMVIPINPALGQRPLECNRCFRVVHPAVRQVPPQRTVDEDTEMSGMNPPSPINFYGQSAWRCFTGHIYCKGCPKLAPAYRTGDPSRLWSCDCGITCHSCDKTEAMRKHESDEKEAIRKQESDEKEAREWKEKMDSFAWECRCGTILCGACKVVAESD